MWAVLAEHPSLLPAGCGRHPGTVWSNTGTERECLRLCSETGRHPLGPQALPGWAEAGEGRCPGAARGPWQQQSQRWTSLGASLRGAEPHRG